MSETTVGEAWTLLPWEACRGGTSRKIAPLEKKRHRDTGTLEIAYPCTQWLSLNDTT